MKMARVILFTGQIDAMSKFYGKVLGLRQIKDEKAGGSLPPVAHVSRRIPALHRRDARVRRLYSTPRRCCYA